MGVLGNNRERCGWELQELCVEMAKKSMKRLGKGVWRLGTEGRRREAESQILALHCEREVGISG